MTTPSLRSAALLSLIILSIITMTSPTAYAQESFPATHVSLLTTRSVADSSRALAIALFNVDRVSRSAEFRISISRSDSPITRYLLVRTHRDRSTETVLSLPPQSGGLTEQGTVTGLSQELLNVLDSGALSLVVQSEAYPETFMSGEIIFAPNVIATEFGPSQIDPRPEGANGRGEFTAVLDPVTRSLAYTTFWSGLTSAPRELRFVRGGSGGDTVMHTISEFNGDSILVDVWSGMTPEDVAAFGNGNIAVLLTTDSHPAGEMRGQLLTIDVFTAVIDPEQPVPSASGSTAEGTGYMMVMDYPGHGYFFKSISAVHGTGTPVESAHLHQGAIGMNGAEIMPLDFESFLGSWEIEEQVPASAVEPSAVAAIRAGDSYLDFHTAGYAGGELRGQLSPLPTNLQRSTSSVAERPKSGEGVLSARFDAGSLSIRLDYPESVGTSQLMAVLYSINGVRIGEVEIDRASRSIPAAGVAAGLYVVQLLADGRSLGSCAVTIVR